MTKTVVLKVSFAKNGGVTKVQRPAATPEVVPEPAPTSRPPTEPGRVARLLALAYRVEQLIDDGVIADYREAARRLGISAAHLTHYIALLDLAVPIQEDILLGRVNVSERQLRSHFKELGWKGQMGTDSILRLGRIRKAPRP